MLLTAATSLVRPHRNPALVPYGHGIPCHQNEWQEITAHAGKFAQL
jgi:hypothetical protein